MLIHNFAIYTADILSNLIRVSEIRGYNMESTYRASKPNHQYKYQMLFVAEYLPLANSKTRKSYDYNCTRNEEMKKFR